MRRREELSRDGLAVCCVRRTHRVPVRLPDEAPVEVKGSGAGRHRVAVQLTSGFAANRARKDAYLTITRRARFNLCCDAGVPPLSSTAMAAACWAP